MLHEIVVDGMALKSADLIAARGVFLQPTYLFNSRSGRLYTMRSWCY
jgi:hypothetical protein